METPLPWWLLLLAVRILHECILVLNAYGMFILPRIFEELLICVVSVRNGVVNSVPTDNWIADLFVHYRLQRKVMFSQACVSHSVKK